MFHESRQTRQLGQLCRAAPTLTARAIITATLLLPCALTGIAWADWAPGDGHKMHFPQLPDEDGWDVRCTFPICLADDWQCSESGFVDEIHWWGSWLGGLEGDGVNFTITIHEDWPVGHPDNPHPYSVPGNPLWYWDGIGDLVTVDIQPGIWEGWYDPQTGDALHPDHDWYVQYNLTNIAAPFWQIEGDIYWLDICADVMSATEDTEWGWKNTEDHWNDAAVWISDLVADWQPLYEPEVPDPILNNWWISFDPTGFPYNNGGTDFFDDGTSYNGWYYYPNTNWWNIWFYDHPLDLNRYKEITIFFEWFPVSEPYDIEVVVNWSTDLWPPDAPPPIPPLTPIEEEMYIHREPIPLLGPGPVEFTLTVPDYNPEWVSVDIRGSNIEIPFGTILHECKGTGTDPLDLSFVINSSAEPSQACCFADPVTDPCQDLIFYDCMQLGGTPQGPGTACTAPEACCLQDGSGTCVDIDPLCCDDIGGYTPYPGGALCEGDISGNGIDDSCEDLAVVVCEDQPPTHPPHYWYDVRSPSSWDFCDFHVRVEDPNRKNYTNWLTPPNWVYAVHKVGGEWWASWWDPSDSCMYAVDSFTFGFDNSNPSTWGAWTVTWSNSNDPYAGVADSSDNHPAEPNGYGYLVHVPVSTGEDYKWVQYPDLLRTGMDVANSLTAIDPSYALADNFECTSPGEAIAEIHIWGSWLDDVLPGGATPDPSAVAFSLAFHVDNGGMPGAEVWRAEVEPGDFVVQRYAQGIAEGWLTPPDTYIPPPADTVCYMYKFSGFDDPFIQEGGPYWLSVLAIPTSPIIGPTFGWKTSLDFYAPDAVWTMNPAPPFVGPWYYLIYPFGHPLYPESVDLAFGLIFEAGATPCVTNADCVIANDNCCEWDRCGTLSIGYCDPVIPMMYGDVAGTTIGSPPNGAVNLTDVLCTLDAFGLGNLNNCPNADVAVVTAADCTHGNAVVNLTDILQVLDAFGAPTSPTATFLCDCPLNPSTSLAWYGNSGCKKGTGSAVAGSGICEGPDQFVLAVGESSLQVTHIDATYNCCPADIEVTLLMAGDTLHMTETEIPPAMCNCNCCYDVTSQVNNLPSGTYLLEYSWYDYELGPQTYLEEFIIP